MCVYIGTSFPSLTSLLSFVDVSFFLYLPHRVPRRRDPRVVACSIFLGLQHYCWYSYDVKAVVEWSTVRESREWENLGVKREPASGFRAPSRLPANIILELHHACHIDARKGFAPCHMCLVDR